MKRYFLTIYCTAACCLLVVLLCGPANSRALQNRWKIQGRVTDQAKPVIGAMVKAINPETGETRETVTDEKGSYLFTELKRGRYLIKVYVRGNLLNETDAFLIGPTLPDRFDVELNLPKTLVKDLEVQTGNTPPVVRPTKPPLPIRSPIPIVTQTPVVGESPPPIEPSPSPSPKGTSIDQIFENLSIGNIAFNTPSAMRLDETASIELALSPTKALAELKQAVQEPGRIETAEIKISEFMEAKLVGLGFEIREVRPTRQFVSKTEDTLWKWDIKAIKPGRQRVNLTLNVIIEDRGREITRALQTFTKDIEIEVSFSSRVKGFVENNWQWLWATLVVPIAAWLWRRYSVRKKQSDSSSER